MVERAIQSVEGQVRVLKVALEERWKVKVPAASAVIPWLMEYAAYLLNRFEVGHDGKTAYERCKGKAARCSGIEFGEAVLWRKKRVGGALGKLSSMWEDGVFLGVKGKTGEFIIGDEKGVWKTRTVQRKPMEERWQADNARYVQWVPWRVNEEDARMDGERLEVIRVEPRGEERPEREEDFEVVPRRAKIFRTDLERHGYTAGCDGCKAAMLGKTARGHNEKCRKRLEDLLKDEPRMKEANTRANEFISKVMEEEEEEEERKKKMRTGDDTKLEEERRKQARARGEEVEGQRKHMRIEEKRGDKRKSDADAEEAAEDDDGDVVLRGADAVEIEAEEEEGEGDAAGWPEEVIDMKTGARMDPRLVAEARAEEMQYMEDIELYEEVEVEECWAETGKGPVSTKWVDVNKGCEEEPDVRCRLVARDFKPKGEKDRSDLFAATPPLEAKKLLFQLAVNDNARRRGSRRPGIKIMFIDVKKAHLYGVLKPDERAYIELPGEGGKRGKCGRLKRWLYGMRPAAGAWEDEYSEKLIAMGFVKGRAVPTAFFRPSDQVRCVVHGDDFTFTGERGPLEGVAARMKEHYQLKVRGILGDEERDDREIVILNRRLRWTAEGLEYEADRRHVKDILAYFGLTKESKGLDLPVVKDEEEKEAEEEEELGSAEATAFRGVAARANYLASDRLDIQFAVKEVCRHMAKPRAASMARLKRLARYLLKHQRGVLHFRAQPESDDTLVEVYTDSDWAGCRRTRKSTSGGVLLVGGGLLKSWSSTQPTLAMSSGEAEFIAMVKAASEGLGLVALMGDLGWPARLKVWVDSSAAKSMASRVGLGRVRHMEVKLLWLQEAVRKKRLEVGKVRGDLNPADWLTKPHSLPKVKEAMERWGYEVERRSEEKEEEEEKREKEGKVGRRPRWADVEDDDEEEEEKKEDIERGPSRVATGPARRSVGDAMQQQHEEMEAVVGR